MSELGNLKPTSKPRVIDLVSEAGHDVSDWGMFSRGPKYAAANPKYCYEWSFSQVGRATILNMWYAHMTEQGGKMVIDGNVRASLDGFTGIAKSSTSKTTNRVWQEVSS